MNVNATLIVQMFNFFITYWILRLFLFKPVVAIIERENAQETVLHDIIDQQKKSLEIQEKERQRHWFMCQEYFVAHQPHSLPQKKQFLSDTSLYDTEMVTSTSGDNTAHTISDIRNALEEKIKHVH